MERLIEQLSRGPKPPPQPVCDKNCGQTFVRGPNGRVEITCPCGFGYYDFEKQEFVPGSLVRAGQRPSREEYVAHVQQCSQRRVGSPIVGTIFLGVRSGEESASSQSDSLPAHSAAATLPTRARTEKSQGNFDKSSQNEYLEEESNSRTSTDAEQSLFIPRAGIAEEVLLYYMKLLGYEHVKLEKQKKDQKLGWLMKGFDLKVEDSKWKELLSDVIRDSQDWVEEAKQTGNTPYEKSKTAAKRKKKGPIKLQPPKMTSTVNNARKPYHTPNQSLSKMPEAQSEIIGRKSEATELRTSVETHNPTPIGTDSPRQSEQKNSYDQQSMSLQDKMPKHTKGDSLDSGIGGSPRDRGAKSKPGQKLSSSDTEEASEMDNNLKETTANQQTERHQMSKLHKK